MPICLDTEDSSTVRDESFDSGYLSFLSIFYLFLGSSSICEYGFRVYLLQARSRCSANIG